MPLPCPAQAMNSLTSPSKSWALFRPARPNSRSTDDSICILAIILRRGMERFMQVSGLECAQNKHNLLRGLPGLYHHVDYIPFCSTYESNQLVSANCVFLGGAIMFNTRWSPFCSCMHNHLEIRIEPILTSLRFITQQGVGRSIPFPDLPRLRVCGLCLCPEISLVG